MAFPDERDRNLIRRAEQVEHLATGLCDWLSEFNPARRTTDLLPIAESDEFEVLQLRRLAGSLYTSAKVPVAAAAYGASQVGKSLFMGQVLRPHSEDYCPIGGDETLGRAGLLQEPLLRQRPQSAVRLAGSHRPGHPLHHQGPHRRQSFSPNYPVMVRALTRVEWLRVLARGFHAECKTPAANLAAGRIGGALRGPRSPITPATEVDRRWRMDLLDAYSYMRAGRSPRIPGQGGDLQRAVEPLSAERRGLRRRGRRHLLGQLGIR